MAPTNEKNKQLAVGEVLSSDHVGAYMAMGGGLGGGMIHIPDDPSYVWPQLWWNRPFANYVYRDMEMKDDKISGDLEVRKEAVLAKERVIIPASDKRQDKKVAEFIEETLSYAGGSPVGGNLPFENVLGEAMDALGKGVAIGEIEYANASDRVFIKDIHFKPQHLFSFGAGPFSQYASYAYPQTGPLRIRPGLMIEGVDLERPLEDQYPGKWFVHTFRQYQGDRWGTPLGMRCYWLSWFKRAGMKDWLRMLDKASGTVLARYPRGAGPDEQAKALGAAQAVAEEAMAAVPAGYEIEVLDHVRDVKSHKDFVDDICNNGIARIILGQTLTSRGNEGGSGSRALGQVHERVAQTKTEVDAKSLMLPVNVNVVWPLVRHNFGENVPPPTWAIRYSPGADLKLFTDAFYRGWQMGVPSSKKFYYTTTQFAEPVDETDILPPPSKDEQTGQVPGDTQGESAAFGEPEVGGQRPEVSKKKSSSNSTRLKQPPLKRERFSSLRPSSMKSSDR